MDKYCVNNLVASQCSRLDRFVLPRESVEETRRRHSWPEDAGSSRGNVTDIWDPKQRKVLKYQEYLNEVLGLKSQRVRNRNIPDSEPRLFPCRPRKKRFLNYDCVLSLPAYDRFVFPDILDWGKKNTLVATMNHEYYIFDWQQQSVLGHGLTLEEIRSCKFHPKGDILLLGTEERGFEQHDSIEMKCITKKKCPCSDMSKTCTIYAIDWSPTGNSFVIGCSQGLLSSYTGENKLIGKWDGMLGLVIYSVRVSPDTRFVAAAGMQSAKFHILHWPHLQYLMSFHSDWFWIQSLSWHPWRSALLGIGYDVGRRAKECQPQVGLCDPRKSEMRLTSFKGSPRRLDNMLFSQCTGEMVLSVWNPDNEISEQSPTSGTLMVMSDQNTVVDQSETTSARVGSMVFSPDGTNLATATAANDLMVWHFLPEEKKKETAERSRRFHAMPAYTDEVAIGFVLR